MEEVEEIAIVGIGCRFPGANNIKEFWDVLVNGENHVKEIPGDRWNLDAIYDPDPDAYGKTYVRRAGLLSKHDVWDNDFFGIAEKEASEMDPQQRYVLECVHMALEDGGITRTELDGSPTSVYIGAMNSDAKSSKDGDYSLMTNYTVTGDAASIITARVSYNYNLLGPSLTIDTACSSSLVAINLATQSLRIGESSMAICGGVNSILYPDMFVTLTKARMASPTGQCQAFSAKADGYARGEGCGIIILERLSDALRNDRHIWATIRTGCNQDGRTAKPITAPSEIQQRQLLRDIYLNFYHISPSDVQYIEAHGTGTPIGDPVEVNSLGSFFKDYPIYNDDVKQQRYIGSVKTNIGHLESGAGAASLIKTLLMMKHGQIVPSLHSFPRNPKIDFENYELDVPTSVHSWPALQDGSRAACINCFGFGGTNSHAFVRQWIADSTDSCPRKSNDGNLTCVPVSAKSQICLINTIKHLVARVTKETCNLKQLAYTASCKRDHHRYRKLLIESSVEDLIKSCNGAIDMISNSTISPGKNYRIVYVFCGVGTAWTKMGMELVRDFAVFADTLRSIDTYLTSLAGWSITDKIRDGADMEDPFISHIGIFACQLGLSNLLKHWGIYPDAIVGQSVGEVAAAYSSGVLSLRDAVTVIYNRSKWLAETSKGKMVVVRNVDTTKVAQICEKVGHVDIAVHISPVACTVSGDVDHVTTVKSDIVKNAKLANHHTPFLHDLKVECAYHSHKVDHAAKHVKECLDEIEPKSQNIPIFSTVTGKIADDFGTPEYWQRNVAKPVLFYQALQESTSEKPTVFLEIGPQPVLKAHLRDIFIDEDVTAITSMKSNCGSLQIFTMLSDLYTLGINPRWENIVEKHHLTDIPQYQFDGKLLMVESDFRFLRKQGLADDSSGRYLMLTQKETVGAFKVNFSPNATPFVYEHIIDDAVIIPGAAYTEVALELGMSVMDVAAESLHIQYDIVKAAPLSKGKPSYLDMTSEKIETNDGFTDIVFTIAKDEIPVAKGTVTNRHYTQRYIVPIEDVRIGTGRYMEGKEIYRELAKHGYKYGPSVQVLESITFNKDECTGYIKLTEDVARQINQTSFHPAILDAMMHSSALRFLSDQKTTSYKIYPIRIGRVSVFRSFEKEMICYTRIVQEVCDRSITNIILTRLDGLVLAEVKEIEHRIMDGSIGANVLAYEVTWTVENMKTVISDVESSQKVTICYEDGSVHNILRALYPRGESFRLRDVADNPAPMISATTTKDVITILFVPDSNVFKQSKSGDDVFYNVCQNCEAFFKVMKKFKDTEKNVIIVTENTQDGGGNTNTNRSIFGAELWGFTRSLRQEGTKCRMVLIDVQPSIVAEVGTLYKTIKFLTSSNKSLTECLIVDGHMHSNFLQRRLQSGLQNEHRIISTDEHLDLQLRSTNSDRIENPYLIPGERFCESRKNEILLKVDEICIPSPAAFCVTELDLSLQNSLWTDYKDGYPVIALEFLGTVLCPKRSKRVVACYPTRVTNRISVPEQCVCDRASLPMYTPGLITKSLLVWHIMKRVKEKSTVCIVTESDPSDDETLTLLCDMLKTVKHSHAQTASICALNDESKCKVGVFVLLEKYPRAQIECILEAGNTIIGYDDALSCVATQVFQMTSKGVKINIISRKNIFDSIHVTSTFPKVTRWLKRQSRRHDFCYNAHRSLNQPTVKLPNGQGGEKVNMNTKAMEDKLIHKNGTYVVVGGLTGLGWEIVKWLGYKGAGVVVSLSRKGRNPQMEVQLQNSMDIHKYKIVPMSCDVANYADVKKTFSAIKTRFPNHPIKGIFQGAGVLRDTRIETMTMEKFKEVLQPKVLGTWNLHLVSKDLLLDFFVMHSSTTSVFGNAGQTNYGAANSFMDSLAMYRRSNNLPGQSINWSALAVGMASDETIRNTLEAQGYYVLETKQIKECLLDALLRNPCQVVYGLFDWNVIGKNPAMMRTSASDKEGVGEVKKSTGKRHLVNTVLNISKTMEESFEDQRQTVTHLMFSGVSRVLSIDDKELEESQNLLSLGMESQKAVELIQVVKESTGCRLPVAYILSANHSIGMLIDFVHSNIIDYFKMEARETSELKEDVHGSPTWMEKFYIEMHENNPHDSSLWYSIDFKLGSGLSNIDLWRTLLRWITIRNPELRTVYRPTEDNFRFGMKKVVLDPDDAKIDLRYVDSCVIARQTDQDISKYCTFDITTDPPLRVLYCNTGRKHRLRFIISHVSFDLQSFFVLVQQMRSHIESYIFKKDVSLTPADIPDIAALMEQRLNEERSFLENFWRDELQKIHDVPSIIRPGIPLQISENTDKLSLRLPDDLVERINTNNFDVTAAVLLFSLYKILLRQMTCISTIPVVLTMDMRQHFPEFIDRIFLGTNYIPVITEFSGAHDTLRECISECSNQVMLSSACSLYPFELIKQTDGYKQNCFRHFFNVRDISEETTRRSQYSAYYMERENYITGFLNQIETALNVVTDRNARSMELVLSYDTQTVSPTTAKTMLDDLSLLASAAVTSPDIRLNEIPLESSVTSAVVKIDKCLSTVPFIKETSKGWEHPAKLKVDMADNIPKIVWNNPDSKRTSIQSRIMTLQNTIPIPYVLDVDIGKLCDSWCLFIQTTKRRYCFKSMDYFMVQAWRSRIRKLLSSNRKNARHNGAENRGNVGISRSNAINK
ncbi:reducing polyketide synthase PKS1-like [Pecten maximus]|uniref:reducing polyketide synthase PKS1-like n=1 Tax=Pecten maximus TaxID=6579 RepID=UPI001458E4AD|nr:reducing polyketide synthase PKS1-like [Pecten maximus]